MVAEHIRHLKLIAIPSPGTGAHQLTFEHPVEPLVLRHPEVAPVLSRAVSAVTAEFASGSQTPPHLIRELEHAAALAVAEVYEPIAATASRLLISTLARRATRAAGARQRAEQLRTVASETATALHERHHQLAESTAAAATNAARDVAACSVPGHKLAARKLAVQEANAVRATATARADQRAAVARLTAAVASQAAVRLATETERAADIVEREALGAAGALQAAALDVAYDVAVDAACRHLDSSRGLT